jgi:hypothetical protein
MRTRFHVIVGFLMLFVSYGCRGSAEIEMNEARRAMEEAERVRTESLAPADFEKARKAWERAQDADKEGNTGAAKVLYTSARIYFGQAADIARSRRDALSRELNGMQPVIGETLDKVKLDLSMEKSTPERRARVKAIVAEVETMNKSMAELVKEQDLVQAVAAAKDVQTKLYHAQLILTGREPK